MTLVVKSFNIIVNDINIMSMRDQQDKNIIETLFNPFQRFIRIEASGGIILLFASIVALFWANSSFGHYYYELWESHITFQLGNFVLSKTLHHWINDGLMAIFFFVVGLEIKREFIAGELSSLKQASLPIMAAIGGMVLPALLYISINSNENTSAGWGIPMATDIAFSLGVLSLLGKRVPVALKVFLVAFAIIDDLGAVIIIAFFYSGSIHWEYLLAGISLFIILIAFNRLNFRYIPAYMIIGWIICYMFLKSGIHPTIAGVLIAFSIPVKRKIKVAAFRNKMNSNLDFFCPGDCPDEFTLSYEQLSAIDNMEDELDKVQSPVQSLEHTLHHFVSFFIMPVFALANAGVVINISGISDLFMNISGTIEISILFGKVIGISLFSWLSVKIGLSQLPDNIKWVHIIGLGFLGGMGFTMSLFIANLAFTEPELINPAKIGILVGSFIAGIVGFIILNATLSRKK